MSLQKYFESKEKLKEAVQIATTNQNLRVAKEKQTEDEIAGASTHRRNSKIWWVDISNKNNDETLSAICRQPFFHENQKFSAG